MTTTNANNTIATPAPLSQDELNRLVVEQNDESNVYVAGTSYQRQRAVAYFSRHKFVTSVTPEALAYHAEKAMDYKVDGLKLEGAARDYQKCAMAILMLDVLRETDKATKADYNNRISDLRRALEALNYFASEIDGMTDDQFVVWFAKKGGLDAISREFRQANSNEVEPVRDDKKINAAINGMIENTNGVEVDNPLGATGVRLFVARGEGSKMRLVPLDVSSDFIASLSDRAPDPMTNAPARVVMFREMLATAARIVPDQMSDTPKRQLRPGEKASATTVMLPANQIIRVQDGVFSIAGSRVEDTLIVEVNPGDGILKRTLSANGFIDTIMRKNMLAKLEPTVTASGFNKVVIADEESASGPEVRISFEHNVKSTSGDLLVKSIERMRSLYTWRVKDFDSTASAVMGEAERKKFNDEFFAQVVKSREDVPITVSVGPKGFTFKFSGGETQTVGATEIVGAEAARVTKGDFERALNGLLALPLGEGDITWSIDPRGLLRIEAATPSASYRVFIQLLRKEKDPKAQVRERALLEKVARTVEVAAAA